MRLQVMSLLFVLIGAAVLVSLAEGKRERYVWKKKFNPPAVRKRTDILQDPARVNVQGDAGPAIPPYMSYKEKRSLRKLERQYKRNLRKSLRR